MDVDISRWVLDFLLRQSLDDRVLNALVRVLPLSDNNSSIKKTMLLRRVESEIANGLVSEKFLELLELIEELDYEEGTEASEAMKAAYCAVAVDCAVRVLEENVDNKEGKYFEAVKRIWRGRIWKMERSEKVGLISEELRSWKDEIEAAVWDASACINVITRNKGNNALEAIRVYVAETKEKMGPSFLELVAEKLRDDAMRGVLGLGSREICDQVRMENMSDAGQGLVVSNTNAGMHKGNLPPRRKHVAHKRTRGAITGTSRGVKISETDELGVGTSCNKYNVLPTPEVNKIREALESSSLELQAAVKDPLPDALHLAETVMSNMGKEYVNHEPAVGNQDRAAVNAPNPSVENGFEAIQANESNVGDQSCRHQNNAAKPSLFAWNSTACTYEWDDSVDGLPKESPNQWSRLRLPSPKQRVVSPLKKYEITKFKKRRKIKKWSTLEEDTLRTGVQKYGKGNWKLILNSYRDIFEERTEVDLKDKWRNMTRY